jgi:hypothetical protein
VFINVYTQPAGPPCRSWSGFVTGAAHAWARYVISEGYVCEKVCGAREWVSIRVLGYMYVMYIRYGTRTRGPRAPVDGSLMHVRWEASELLYANIRKYTGRAHGIHARGRTARSCMSDEKRASSSTPVLELETATCCLPRRVRFQDAVICSQVVQSPQFEVRSARREHSCSLYFPPSEPSKTGLVTMRWFLAYPHHRPWLVRKKERCRVALEMPSTHPP